LTAADNNTINILGIAHRNPKEWGMHGQGPHHPWADPRLNDPRNPDPNNYIANGAASVLGWDTVQAAANAVQQTFHGQQTWQRDMESQAAYVRMLAEQGLPHQAIQQRHYAEQMEPLRAIRTKAGTTVPVCDLMPGQS
jgi:hypothetical protein